MGKKLGIGCIVLGVMCLLVAIGCVFYNNYEAKAGEQTSRALLEKVQANIYGAEDTQQENLADGILPGEMQSPATGQMFTVSAGEYASIGILSIPVLDLELPVLTDWSYEKLRKAPCHYYGSLETSDFVIAAHNYAAHFGKLSQLQPGDLVLFLDATGQTHCYEVVLLETLLPTATEEMITSGFDLSLYTCTPGGANRVTARCNLKK